MPNYLKIGVVNQDMDWNDISRSAPKLHLEYILQAIKANGHQVLLVQPIHGRKVACVSNDNTLLNSDLSFSNIRLFIFIESLARRIQSEIRLPWFQIFDSLRVLDGCINNFADFDILYERNYMYGIGGALASRWLKIPYVLFVDADFLLESNYMGIKYSGFERTIIKKTALINYRFADSIVCVSQATKDYLITNYKLRGEKIIVLPNGVDVNRFNPNCDAKSMRKKLGLKVEPVIMFVGGFFPWHDVKILVDSFSKIVTSFPEAKLVLVGDGQTRPSIQKIIEEKCLDASVIFTGKIEHESIPEMLSIANVVVAPYKKSDQEFWGSPLKLYEYMSSGKTIIATRCGQIRDVIIDGHNGCLVEPENVEDMTNTILELLNDPIKQKQLGENARRDALEKHSWKQYINKLESVFWKTAGQSEL